VARILVADDDGHIREVVRFALEQAGHTVLEAADGKAAVATFSNSVDLVVLHIVMPELDGLEVCRCLRQHSRVPIIFLSSRDDELDRVLGLELGADDYVTKPFSPRELVARVRAVLRRLNSVPAAEAAAKHYGALSMDLGRHRCAFNGTEVVLTVTEFALLATLIDAPGQVFSRDQLVARAYGDGHVITERTVDSHIRRIRQKLEAIAASPIETVYGLGYRLHEEQGA
jgi:two-component system, OmpR family, response regulator